jgi:hypothetical protein
VLVHRRRVVSAAVSGKDSCASSWRTDLQSSMATLSGLGPRRLSPRSFNSASSARLCPRSPTPTTLRNVYTLNTHPRHIRAPGFIRRRTAMRNIHGRPVDPDKQLITRSRAPRAGGARSPRRYGGRSSATSDDARWTWPKKAATSQGVERRIRIRLMPVFNSVTRCQINVIQLQGLAVQRSQQIQSCGPPSGEECSLGCKLRP